MALTVEFEENNLVIVHVAGVLVRTEADAIKKQVVAFIKRHGRAKVLILIDEGFLNIATFVNWDDDEDDEFLQQHVDGVALVGDLKWRDSALLFLLHGFVPFSIEFFKTGQEAFARAWLSC
ncbi:MAG: STAS/SEC14 domain-containing protein [Methylovulum sp.]|nr:STAS/SEC14 domain-containing protein [Methylovulum sp.]